MAEQMVMGIEAASCGIQKRLLHAGKEQVEYQDGTKVYFHYKTVIQESGEVLDDSKATDASKPMEIIIGKKFKLEIWERALKTMWLHEVAKFSVIKELLYDYPLVSKQLREYYESIAPAKPKCSNTDPNHVHSHSHSHDHSKNTAHRGHCCGFNIMEHGVGYADLDAILKNPKDLDFIFEVVRVEQPGEFKKDGWSLSDDEKSALIPILKQEGNELFKAGQYEEAAAKYQEAIGYLEQFLLKEKPNDVEWNAINVQKMPILLNFSMCKFHLKDFYACIEHTTSILEVQPDNIKALFRRAKAHIEVWNVEEARSDLQRCITLDATMKREVDALLELLTARVNAKNKEERQKFQGKLF